MTFESVRSWFEAGHVLPLIAFTLIAVLAAAFAARQMSSFRTFELLRYLESEDHIEALSIVAMEIRPLRASEWWLAEGNGRLVEVASEVASLYDVLYGPICRSDDETRSLFYGTWADAIVRSHDALAGYIEYRRRDPKSSSTYKGFSDLAAAVRSHAVGVP